MDPLSLNNLLIKRLILVEGNQSSLMVKSPVTAEGSKNAGRGFPVFKHFNTVPQSGFHASAPAGRKSQIKCGCLKCTLSITNSERQLKHRVTKMMISTDDISSSFNQTNRLIHHEDNPIPFLHSDTIQIVAFVNMKHISAYIGIIFGVCVQGMFVQHRI